MIHAIFTQGTQYLKADHILIDLNEISFKKNSDKL